MLLFLLVQSILIINLSSSLISPAAGPKHSSETPHWYQEEGHYVPLLACCHRLPEKYRTIPMIIYLILKNCMDSSCPIPPSDPWDLLTNHCSSFMPSVKIQGWRTFFLLLKLWNSLPLTLEFPLQWHLKNSFKDPSFFFCLLKVIIKKMTGHIIYLFSVQLNLFLMWSINRLDSKSRESPKTGQSLMPAQQNMEHKT